MARFSYLRSYMRYGPIRLNLCLSTYKTDLKKQYRKEFVIEQFDRILLKIKAGAS